MFDDSCSGCLTSSEIANLLKVWEDFQSCILKVSQWDEYENDIAWYELITSVGVQQQPLGTPLRVINQKKWLLAKIKYGL